MQNGVSWFGMVYYGMRDGPAIGKSPEGGRKVVKILLLSTFFAKYL